MPYRTIVIIFTGVLGLALFTGSVQAQTGATEQRLLRLERILDNSVLIDMVQRIESLQNEVRQLRGELEQKDNALSSMRERQRKLYLDTDSRLQVLESGGGGGGSLDDLESLEDFDVETASSNGFEGEGISLSTLQTTDPAPAPRPAQTSSANEQQEKLDYQNAYDLLILGRNGEAITEFQNFLSRYPDGTFADNAHYWLGEANYVERNFSDSIDRFNVVIFQFPASRKVADARLRKGFALFELQRYAEARQELVQVEREYRGRSIAALARRRIEQMNNAGL